MRTRPQPVDDPGVQDCADLRVLRILDRVAPIALDEGHDDVLAAKRGQQLLPRPVVEVVDTGLCGQDLVIQQIRGTVRS
jgi:hypothetical protein